MNGNSGARSRLQRTINIPPPEVRPVSVGKVNVSSRGLQTPQILCDKAWLMNCPTTLGEGITKVVASELRFQVSVGQMTFEWEYHLQGAQF